MGNEGTTDGARQRVVVLGASNVARALPWVVSGARAAVGRPVDLLVATGRGRSFGAWAGILGLARPGIVDCGLWRALDAGRGPLDALVTDVGNDVLYGSSAGTIARWVETCLARLREREPRTLVLSGLPIERLRELGPREFRFWRRVFYPARRLRYADVLATVEELHARLGELARSFDAEWIVPPRRWYGLDPVHVPRARFPEAWGSWLAPFGGSSESAGLPGQPPPRSPLGPACPRPGLGLRLGLARARSERIRCLGRPWTAEQPSARLPDGTTLGLF